MKAPRGTPERVRFWSFVDSPDKGCWLWQGSRFRSGYGAFMRKGQIKVGAHCLSWEIYHGQPVPKGMVIRHTCDNPPCVRPSHLVLSTHLENIQDRDAKGRGRSGNTGKTHCKRGHEFTPENTYEAGKHRQCRECNRATWRKYSRKRYAAQKAAP